MSFVLVAHRGANLDNGCSPPPSRLRPADVLEADVHRFRNRMEVRHSKALWPTSRLIDGGKLLPGDAARPLFADVLRAVGDEFELWIDLKGPDLRLARGVAELIGERSRLWVSARCWWQLVPFRHRSGARTFVSVGSLWQRPLARLVLALSWSDGIVIHERLVSRSFLTALSDASCVVTWAVETPERARELIELGVGGLIIDSPRLLSELRSGLDVADHYDGPTP